MKKIACIPVLMIALLWMGISTSQAQFTVPVTINNQIPTDTFEVFVNKNAWPDLCPVGVGDVYLIPPGITTFNFSFANPTHVPAFGIRQYGKTCPPKVVAFNCPNAPSNTCPPCYVGTCFTYLGMTNAPTLLIN